MGELKSGQKKIVTALGEHMAKDKSVTKDDLLNFMRQFQMENEKKKLNDGFFTDTIVYNPPKDTVKYRIRYNQVIK